MILLLHNRYRVAGGEERAVEDLAWLIRTELGEDVETLTRDSASLGNARAAAGLLRGGLDPDAVAAAVRRTGARVVHAHNLQPTFGWRALVAARAAGARVVLHLHNYRLVCAVGTCFTEGADCTRCHGRNTWPGVRLNCRGGSRAESLAYGAGLALWQRRLVASADAFVVPSAFALRRLEGLGAPLGGRARVIPSVQRAFAERSTADAGTYALYAGRLTEEKGVADAIAACRLAGVPLVIAGDGPQASALRALAAEGVRAAAVTGGAAASRAATSHAASSRAAASHSAPHAAAPHAAAPDPAANDAAPPRAAAPDPGAPHAAAPDLAAPDAAAPDLAAPDAAAWDAASKEVAAKETAAPAAPPPQPAVHFAGRVDPAELARLRAGAGLALVPSRYEEILPLAALEAMAAGVPVVASRAGGLAEIVPPEGLHAPGDVSAMAELIRARFGDTAAGEAALAVARARTAPSVVAGLLRSTYDAA